MSYRFVDCNGLGGAFSLGMVQSGFELTHKCGSLNLGKKMVLANRPVLGWGWETQFSKDPTDWHIPEDVDVVIGSPPCSGFSTLTRKDLRGVDADVNVHIRNFATYVGRVAPKIAAFESVQHAYKLGHDLMLEARDTVERLSGQKYHLYHLMHNALSLGGPANRPRYFWVVARVPFGVEYAEPDRVPTFIETIGDLRGLSNTWEKQPYRYPETWWSARRRSPDGAVDGHAELNMTHHKRIHALLDALDGEWPQGWKEEDALRAVYAKYGHLPDIWKSQEERLVKRNFDMGVNQLLRWYADRPCRVITGGALSQALHPTENRMFTHREAARIQDFPDTWSLWPVRNDKSLNRAFGKGIPTSAGRYFGHWAREALDGRPGTMTGQPVGDRETLLQVDKGFKRALQRAGRRRHEFWSLTA
jgi:DNA (cytosine-5)-methyltransferase 1